MCIRDRFDPEVFASLLAEADARLEAGLARMPRIVGSDIDPRAIEIARAQAGRVGLAGFIDLAVANCADIEATVSYTHLTEYRRCDTDEREWIGHKLAARTSRNVLYRDG